MRILVAISPRMYREAVALTIHSQRPGHEVRMVAPEDTAREVVGFRPHLLVHNDDDGLDPEALSEVPFWVEICYSNGMDARVCADEKVSEARDISIQEMLRVVDKAAAHMGGS